MAADMAVVERPSEDPPAPPPGYGAVEFTRVQGGKRVVGWCHSMTDGELMKCVWDDENGWSDWYLVF